MVVFKTGNILDAKEKIIAHPVNCAGNVEGITAAVFEKWPDSANDYYQLTARLNKTMLLGMAHLTGEQKDGHIICSMYCEAFPGEYNQKALEDSLYMLVEYAKYTNRSVALPYSTAYGPWEDVIYIIERIMENVDCVIYKEVSNT